MANCAYWLWMIMILFDSHYLNICSTKVSKGQKGLYMFDKMGYDYVVTDYGMPQMDGLKMAKEIKKKYPDAVVIMMSGDQKIKFQTENVVNHFLEKPFMFDAVYNLMVNRDEFDTGVMA